MSQLTHAPLPTPAAARTAIRADSLTLVPSSRVERLVATSVIFFLAYGLPNIWLVRPGDLFAAPKHYTYLTAFLIFVVFFVVTTLQFDVGPVAQLIREEAALPTLVALIVVSSAWSSRWQESAKDALLMVLITLIGYWLVIRFPLATIIGMAGLAFAAGTILQLAVVRFAPEYGVGVDGWVGTFKNRNVFGRHLTLVLLVLLLAARTHRRFRIPFYAAAAGAGVLLANANSKTSLVAAVATPLMAGVFVAFRARRTLYGAVSITMLGAAITVVALTLGNVSFFTEQLDRADNLTGRTEIWKLVFPHIFDRPFFGYGWKGFFTDWFGPARPIYFEFGPLPHAHNALLQYAVDLGLVGLGLVVWLFVRLVVRGARIVRYYRGAVGVFPLLFASYVLITSITEYGVIASDAHYLMFVVAIGAAIPGRRDAVTLAALDAGVPLDRGLASRLRRTTRPSR